MSVNLIENKNIQLAICKIRTLYKKLLSEKITSENLDDIICSIEYLNHLEGEIRSMRQDLFSQIVNSRLRLEMINEGKDAIKK